jgi:small subunit ribosomal protein S1
MDQDKNTWEAGIPRRYQPGEIVKARVTTIGRFGIVVELEPGIEGMVHVSELADRPPHRIADLVKVGEEIDLMVLAVHVNERRIGLSRKCVPK